ncbi:MAG: tetraacyldisaccharide 4'-kinase [Acidobacteriia bacterium]|nr:tetraacyldisaccharide 4'-kinase [Terriglobia bacterium]
MKPSSGWLVLLWPVSILYSVLSLARSWAYTRGIFRVRKLPGTVISVGNLTAGGTGKTPMVLWIAERLALQGKHAAILTRGYRGTLDANAKDATSNAKATTAGLPQSDEVAILRDRLAGRVQLGVGPDRFKNGETLARHGVDWFVLDDGFQHRKLARDADIVLLDATDPFGGGRTLPSGRLREPVSALRRADLVVITRSVQAPAPALEAVVRRHTRSPIFYAATKFVSVLRVPRLDVALPPADWPCARFLAFCAIGNPPAFFADLRALEFQIAVERSFPDHHVYTLQEAAELEKAAQAAGADALLCTEKDVWNLRHVQFTALPVYCARISFQLPENFWDALQEVIHRRQSGSQP